VPPGTNPNPTGRYRLEYIEMPMNTGGVIPEGAEPNSTVATATPLAQGQRGIGNISISTGPDANDWWGPIVLSSPAVLMFQTAQTGATPIQDTTINIRNYDPILNALGPASAATSGNILDPTSHARGTFLFNLAPNTYYLEVVSPGTAATQAGDYALELSIAQNNPYVAGAYAFATVNTSCLGSNGQRPTISTDNTRELPVLGTTFSRTLGAMQPGAVFFVLQGLDFHFANGGTTPLPFNLAFFGAPNCSIHVDPAVSTLGIGGPAGTAVLNQATPPVLALRGLPIYEQAAVLDLPANPLGLTVSNYARQILGERSY
jgi:hypothetical protein